MEKKQKQKQKKRCPLRFRFADPAGLTTTVVISDMTPAMLTAARVLNLTTYGQTFAAASNRVAALEAEEAREKLSSAKEAL